MTRRACVLCGESASGKYAGPCSSCGDDICPKHAHFYIDGDNIAITNSARPKCAECAGVVIA